MIEINKKRYRDFDSYMKIKFGKKIIKLPIDGGFSCPNRINGKKGCLFCSETGSGEWTCGEHSIKNQIAFQKIRLSKPGRDEGYLAYFQNFTNTYDSVERLRDLYYSALECEGIIGLAIATRADCLSDEVLDLLAEIGQKYFLLVELGMQSVNDDTIRIINRGYDHKTFDRGLRKLINMGIYTLVHIIVGLPYEDEYDFMAGISYINEARPWGIKIHNLYIEKDTRMADFYEKNKLDYDIDLDTYVRIVVAMVRYLDPSIVINRLTGDGIRENILYPDWSKNKAKILTSIDKYMKDNDYRQGDLWKES